MKGIILAAGRGTRLKPLTYGIPKPLLPVGGRPVIDYVLDNMATAYPDVTEVFVAVSWMKETIESYLRHTPRPKLHVETVTTLGWDTGGDLRAIAIEKDIDEPVVVAYGDNVTTIDLGEMIAFHKQQGLPATVALFEVPWEDASRFGIAELSGGNVVTSFTEKPPEGTAKTNLANAGYYILEPSVLQGIPHKKIKIESAIFPELAARGELAGFRCAPPYWLDIGTLDAYRKANKMMEGLIPPPG